MSQFEIEIKSLLGSKEKADALKEKMKEIAPNMALTSKNKQLNHYFTGDVGVLYEKVREHVPNDTLDRLKKILTEGKKHSIRTRKLDDTVLLVVKASIDDTTSSNGISRMEYEEPVDLSLDELDRLLLDAGLAYQAKWSREREEYSDGNMNICIDKNAGYGYLAEFEKVVPSADMAEEVKTDLRGMMDRLGVEELPQDRLERMFAFYNENWPSYYGTDNIFTIE